MHSAAVLFNAYAWKHLATFFMAYDILNGDELLHDKQIFVKFGNLNTVQGLYASRHNNTTEHYQIWYLKQHSAFVSKIGKFVSHTENVQLP